MDTKHSLLVHYMQHTVKIYESSYYSTVYVQNQDLIYSWMISQVSTKMCTPHSNSKRLTQGYTQLSGACQSSSFTAESKNIHN